MMQRRRRADGHGYGLAGLVAEQARIMKRWPNPTQRIGEDV